MSAVTSIQRKKITPESVIRDWFETKAERSPDDELVLPSESGARLWWELNSAKLINAQPLSTHQQDSVAERYLFRLSLKNWIAAK